MPAELPRALVEINYYEAAQEYLRSLPLEHFMEPTSQWYAPGQFISRGAKMAAKIFQSCNMTSTRIIQLRSKFGRNHKQGRRL